MGEFLIKLGCYGMAFGFSTFITGVAEWTLKNIFG